VSAENPVLLVVVGSTRPGRVGLPVARWFEQVARDHGGFDVEVADLAEIDLPLMDEPNHPRLRRYVHQHTRAWSATVDRADAVVFVIPEYNHSFGGALKNAIDFLWNEWKHKPVATVSYGGVSGGLRAVQALKPVLIALSMVPVVEAVVIPFVMQHLTGDGDDRVFTANDEIEAGAKSLLEALTVWMPGTRALRSV
jgi:NAD(P)H-dependent FMN reductase